MAKQSPSRNHRSKGMKVKHVLQICVLVAICFWLIYQVKRSHDKKKAFQEHDANMSVKTHISDEVLKFGRKDLQPRLEQTTIKHDKLDEEEEEEETGGGGKEGNKNEEEEQEEDNNNEEKEDNAKGGDDEMDGGDQEKFQLDDEPEEDLIDGEDREESDAKEAAENDSDDKKGHQNGNISSLENHEEPDGGSSRNAHEAREENYRADDASSAVTHETQTERGTENSNENTETNTKEEEDNKSINATGLKVGKGGMGEEGISPNVTGKRENGSFESEGGSHLNSAMATEFNNQPETGNNLLLQNETETRPETDEAQNATVKNQSITNFMISSNTGNANAAVAQNVTVKDQSITNFIISNNTGNADAVVGESSNPTEFAVPEKVKMFNTTSIAVDDGQSGSLTTEENADRSWNEKSETGNGTEKIRDSSKSRNTDVVQHDSSESSIPLKKEDVTFPEITTEKTNNGDAAAQ